MCETENKLIHHPIYPNRPARQLQCGMSGITMDEVHDIEDAQILPSYPTRHGRDVVDVRFRDHDVRRLLQGPSFELEASVLLPYCFENKVWDPEFFLQ